ncbi:MAG TPA: pyridoxamine 5'-phosphate oxidase family protein [Candidatus Luteococcus avicola]|nr:pyridoxamine 5'-phosphate oxidase family protein [Candidatus Luteococcus avicola]
MDGYFTTLDEQECARLLKENQVGRVAFHGPGGMTIIPVAYLFDGARLVLSTGGGTALGGLADDTPVAFEVDEFDPETRNGWSVMARGRIRVTENAKERPSAPMPWAPGPRDQVRIIKVTGLSGRAVSDQAE